MSAAPEVPVQELAPISAGRSARNRRWAKLLGTFLTGQMVVQGIGLVTGFLLLRWMTVEAYAQYSVAFAFQSTVTILVDVGFNGCIIALVGARGNDPAVIGGYTRVSRTYRGRMFYIVGGLSAVAFPLVVVHQPWGWLTKAALLASILAAVFFDAWDIYRAPLLIHQRLAASYRADAVPAAGRLALSGLLYAVGGLFGWVAAWFSAAMNLGSGLMLKRASADLVHEPERHDPDFAREMIKYLSPLWPGLLFYAFQGQITITLISIFGNSQSIAEVAALGKLSQVFVVLTAFNTVLLVPRFARQSGKELLMTITVGIGGTVAGLLGISTLGFLFPRPFLLLLGKNYVHLQHLVGFVLLSATLSYAAGSLYGVLATKKWVHQRYAWTQILLVISVQTFYLLFVGCKDVFQAVGFGLVTSGVALVCTILFLCRCMIRELRMEVRLVVPR